MSTALKVIGLSVVLLATIGIGIGLAWSQPGQPATRQAPPVTRQAPPIPPGTFVDVYALCNPQTHQLDSYEFVPIDLTLHEEIKVGPNPTDYVYRVSTIKSQGSGKLVATNVDYNTVRNVYTLGVSQGP